MPSVRNLLAVDPSLTCSGWAFFSVSTGEIKAVGKIRGGAASIPLATRLSSLHIQIEQLIRHLNLNSQDALVCEAPTTMRDPLNAIKVEQVRGIFEGIARSSGVAVPGRVNPRSVQHEVIGLRGKQAPRAEVKSAAVRVAHLLYAEKFLMLGISREEKDLNKHQDVVDAVLIGHLALQRLRAAEQSGLSREQLFATAPQGSRRSWRVRPCA